MTVKGLEQNTQPAPPDTFRGRFDSAAILAGNVIKNSSSPRVIRPDTYFSPIIQDGIEYKHLEDPDSPNYSVNALAVQQTFPAQGEEREILLMLSNRVHKFAEQRRWNEQFPGEKTGSVSKVGLWLGRGATFSFTLDPLHNYVHLRGPEHKKSSVLGSETLDDLTEYDQQNIAARRLNVINTGLELMSKTINGGRVEELAEQLLAHEAEVYAPLPPRPVEPSKLAKLFSNFRRRDR